MRAETVAKIRALIAAGHDRNSVLDRLTRLERTELYAALEDAGKLDMELSFELSSPVSIPRHDLRRPTGSGCRRIGPIYGE